jgi:hypothetical protein
MGLLLVVGVLHCFFFLYALGCLEERSEAVVTGIRRGVPISIAHRRFLLINSWFLVIAFAAAFQFVYALGYMVIAKGASAEDVKLYGYLAVAFSLIGGLTWILFGPIWYNYFKSVLRQAEAD